MANWEQIISTCSILLGLIKIYHKEGPFHFSFSTTGKELLIPNFTYLITPTSVQCSSHVFFIVLSAKKNLQQRMAIRSTWARRDRLEKNNATLLFVVGRHQNCSFEYESESFLFGDLLYDMNVLDDAISQTSKTVSGLMWAIKKCPSIPFYVKLDDSNFVHWSALHRALAAHSDDGSSVMWGRAVVNETPCRDPTIATQYVSEKDFPSTFYPMYIKGPLYCMSNVAAAALAAKLRQTPLHQRQFIREDVFITGLSASSLAIERVHHHQFNCIGNWFIKSDAARSPQYYNWTSRDGPVNVIGLTSSEIRHMQRLVDEGHHIVVTCDDVLLLGR